MELTLTTLTPNWPDPLPGGSVGIPYAYTLTVSGSTPPVTYTATGLPAGFTLNPATGLISGTATVTGMSALTASATDSSQGTTMNPTHATWVEPTNADGSPIGSGEITGYSLGIRPSTGTAGTYPTVVAVTGATTLTAALPVLAAGSYAASVQAVGPTNGPWSLEAAFTIAEVPGAPTGLTVA